ncbi:MAG TPA: AraC family transcriptional regulator [Thermoanaerobaculia bacterium]|nr:AraC family transcriptional regulator [Thermoanaerobaculia bacterium]
MAIVLSRGEFFGRVVNAAQWEPFRISETHYARGALLPWHRHEESYLTFVLSGGYRERSAARTQACAARSLIVHPAGETHEDDFAEHATRCLNVVATAGFTARLGDAAAPLLRGAVVDGPHVAGIGARLSAELRHADAASALIVEGLLLELFGAMSRGTASDRRETPAWLAEAHGIVEKRFAEKITLAAVAAAVSVHPVHLARAFRRRYGVSVGERVRALRLEWARERVAAGVALAVVAGEAGFADQSHFTKAFTRAHGVAPSEYRRRLRASRVPAR